MTIKASGRSALILATGVFVCFAGPSQAAVGADNAIANSKSENAAGQKYGSRHSKSYAHRKSGKQELKSSIANKAPAPDVAADEADNSSAIPPSVANANAQFAAAGTPAGNARAMSARANDILQTAEAQPASDGQVVAADQLNDVDRALHEGQLPAATMALASAEAPAAPAAPVMASSQQSSTWDQTSLIGKIFIGFGALLTMASAARMFMALTSLPSG
jgi:hypothetical protein